MLDLIKQYATHELTSHDLSLAKTDMMDEAKALERMIDNKAKKYCERRGWL